MPIETIKKRTGIEHIIRGVEGFNGTRFHASDGFVQLQDAKIQRTKSKRPLQSLQQHIAYMLADGHTDLYFLTNTFALYFVMKEMSIEPHPREFVQYYVAFVEDQYNALRFEHAAANIKSTLLFHRTNPEIKLLLESAASEGRVVKIDDRQSKEIVLGTEAPRGQSEFGMNPFVKASMGCVAEPFAQLRHSINRKGYIHVLRPDDIDKYCDYGVVAVQAVATEFGEIFAEQGCDIKGNIRYVLNPKPFKKSP